MPGTVSKFRTHGDEATAQLLEDVIYRVRQIWPHLCDYLDRPADAAWQGAAAHRQLPCLLWLQEEITHCAAGVRWLSHLHALAQSAHLPAAAAAAAAAAGEAGTSSSENDVPQWVGDARQHASVEAWFHSLVRRHFHGSLKVGPACCDLSIQLWELSVLSQSMSVQSIPTMLAGWLICCMPPAQPPFNTQARAEAGFGEQWYLPLAAMDKQQPSSAERPSPAIDMAQGG
jgi:hypothetical protein